MTENDLNKETTAAIQHPKPPQPPTSKFTTHVILINRHAIHVACAPWGDYTALYMPVDLREMNPTPSYAADSEGRIHQYVGAGEWMHIPLARLAANFHKAKRNFN